MFLVSATAGDIFRRSPKQPQSSMGLFAMSKNASHALNAISIAPERLANRRLRSVGWRRPMPIASSAAVSIRAGHMATVRSAKMPCLTNWISKAPIVDSLAIADPVNTMPIIIVPIRAAWSFQVFWGLSCSMGRCLNP